MSVTDRLFKIAARLDRVGITLARFGLVVVLVWIGGLKVFRYEDEGIVPLVANSPVMSFFYADPHGYKAHMSREGEVVPANRAWHERNRTYPFAYALGSVIVLFGVMIALHPVFPQAAAVGSFLVAVMSVVTLSFLVTTPECWVPNLGSGEHGFPLLAGPGRLIIKDIIMLGAAVVTMADSATAYLRKRDAAGPSVARRSPSLAGVASTSHRALGIAAVALAFQLGAAGCTPSNKAEPNGPATRGPGADTAGPAPAPISGRRAEDEITAISAGKLPHWYRDWRLISVAREEGDLDDIRAILGNDVAISAYREGTRPFPDGAVIARISWGYISSEENNKVFGRAQSFVAGPPKNGVQFMVKDSAEYAATGGWGFFQFDGGKPVGAAVLKSCFQCHVPVRDRDFVFTQYAP